LAEGTEKSEEGTRKPRPWEVESSERGKEFAMFTLRHDEARSPRTGEVHDFDLVESPDGVTVIAVTPDDQMVLVEQFRHPLRELFLETPSGVVDEGEPPLEAAARELREETGYEGSDARHVGTLVLNPSWQTTRVHVVVMRNARRVHPRDLDEGEDIRVRLVPRTEVVDLIRRGEITAAVAVSAVALFEWHARGGERAGA